jgi:hypothetical protein
VNSDHHLAQFVFGGWVCSPCCPVLHVSMYEAGGGVELLAEQAGV